MTKKIFIIFTLFIFCFEITDAQNTRYIFDRISIESGLSQGTVTSIIQDSRGFMWFGTYDGLDRYDGIKFKVYKNDVNDSLSLSHNSITSIFEDRFESLWIGTMSGLNLYDREKENFIRFENNPDDSTSLSNNIVQCLFEDSDGHLWIGSWGGGLDLYNREKGEFRHFRHNPDNPNSLAADFVNRIDQDKDGNLWLATSGGISKFNYKMLSFENYTNNVNDPSTISSNDISTIFVGPKGYIWAGTWGHGINKLNLRTKKITRIIHNSNNPKSLSHNIIRTIYADKLGHLFAATWGGGLDLFDQNANSFLHIVNDPTDPNSLSGNFVYSIYQDRSDIFWVGTDHKGINKFDGKKQKFTHYKKSRDNKNSLNSNSIFSVLENKNGIIWLGTSNGLDRFDPQSKQFRAYTANPDNPEALSNNVVKSICENNGYLWIGTELGLNRFNPKTGKFKRYLPDPENTNSISFHNVYCVFSDSHGILWIGTYSGGLNKYDNKTDIFTHFHHNPDDSNSLGSDFIWCIIEDREGYIWIGTDNNGVSRYDRQLNTFRNFNHNPDDENSISDNKVLCLFEDDKGFIWMGTTAGLNRFDPKTSLFKRYQLKDGLPSNSIQGILEDDQHNLWISSNNGLSKFNPVKETFHNFNESNGLQSNEFAVNSCYKTREGKMYFGGMNGFNVFSPSEIKRNPFIPSVVLTDFKLFNQEVPIATKPGIKSILQKSITETDAIVLSYDQNVFSFEFAALNFSHPQNNQYAYMMENFESDWNYVGNRNFVTYTSLPAGDYIFRVKASNNDGVWNERGTSLNITVKPPFWATWWFRILTLGIILYSILTYQRFRTRIFKEQNIVLEKAVRKKTVEMENLMEKVIRQEKLVAIGKISSSIAHELRNPLGAVKQSAYYLKLKLKDQPQKISEHLNLIENELNIADRVIDDLMEMTRVKSVNKEYIDLETLIHESLKRVNVNSSVQITIKVNPDAHYVWADMIQLRQVLVNLITNAYQALKEKGTILIKSILSENKKHIHILIIDNGLGIKTALMEKVFEPLYTTKAKGTGLGLNICKQIIEKHDGQIQISSKANRGTTVEIILPNKN